MLKLHGGLIGKHGLGAGEMRKDLARLKTAVNRPSGIPVKAAAMPKAQKAAKAPKPAQAVAKKAAPAAPKAKAAPKAAKASAKTAAPKASKGKNSK